MIHRYFYKFLLVIVFAIFSGLPALEADIDHVGIAELSIESNFEECTQEKKTVFENIHVNPLFCGGVPSKLQNRLTVLYQVLALSSLNKSDSRFQVHSSRAPPLLTKT